MAAGRRRGTACAALAITILTLIGGATPQDGFPPFRDFPNPVPYAPLQQSLQPSLQPFQQHSQRPRPFQRDVQQHPAFQQQHGLQQGPFQPPFENKFQQQHQQALLFQHDNTGPYQWEQKHPVPRNASGLSAFQSGPFQTTPAQPLLRPGGGQGDFSGPFFQDPQFDQLFQQELNHQIQLEHQRLQQRPPHLQPQQLQQQQQQQLRPQQQSFQIQQSVQVERPQLQELQELHTLLEQQLQLHEVRQKELQQQQQQQDTLQDMIRQQQQQQQQNLVDSHEIFMSQKIKQQQPSPPRRPAQQQQQQQLQLQKQQLQTPKPTITTTPRAPLEVIDLSQFLPFLQQQQQQAKEKEKDKDKRQQQVQQVQQVQQQRQRQQQRQQDTLRQQEERRSQEQRFKERQRQLVQQQQQRLQQEQERRQKAQQGQRQQRQQPATNSVANGNRTVAEKPVTSVRDLFNTSSCIDPPLTCPHPRIHFYLYTRTTQENGDRVDVTKPESLLSTPFNPKHPIKVLIHGFQGGRQFSPSTDLRRAYFIRGDYNIFVVDYNSLVRLPCLSQIQWSPSFLALCVSQLVTYVGTTSSQSGARVAVPPDRFHLIGYSIGAHIAGLVANFIDRDQGKLGRITGLDPTIIFYQGSNRSHDLDPSDAHFIDVIHTGAGILGQRGPNGHVDYYVNGGTTQPGCQSDSLIKTLSCDHTKVSPYYVESIVSPVGFWALPCPNLFMYLLGFCQPKDEDYILMGEDAPHTARGIYYLSTNANKPYAKGFPGKKMPIKFPKWRPN